MKELRQFYRNIDGICSSCYTCDSFLFTESFDLARIVILCRAIQSILHYSVQRRFSFIETGVVLAVKEDDNVLRIPVEDYFQSTFVECITGLGCFELFILTCILLSLDFPLNIEVIDSQSECHFIPRFDSALVQSTCVKHKPFRDLLREQREVYPYDMRIKVVEQSKNVNLFDISFPFEKSIGICDKMVEILEGIVLK